MLGAAVVASASPASAQPDPALASQVAERDTLIAAQENLLNAYRCMFQVDLGAVKGGQCPADEITPGAAPADPSVADVEARDNLVAAQENLLNAYRCNHQIDTELVPGGCGGQTPSTPEPDPGAGQTPASGDNNAAIAVISGLNRDVRKSCAIRADQTLACWGEPLDVPPAGKFTAIATTFYFSCGIRADQTVACWDNTDFFDHAPSPPEGKFTAISRIGLCGLRTDQTIACWGNQPNLFDVPSGQFTAIATGPSHGCAIRTDRTVACWGENDKGQSDPPSGLFGPPYA